MFLNKVTFLDIFCYFYNKTHLLFLVRIFRGLLNIVLSGFWNKKNDI